MGYKFDKEKYITIGVQQLPFKLQHFLWSSVLKLVKEGIELDYLQVFNITKVEQEGTVKITHEQEEPQQAAFKKEYYVILDEIDGDFEDCKVYIIDDEIHSTMLLAEEY